MNYLDFLNNPKVIEIYNKIDEVNDEPFHHGLKHIKTVCQTMETLCSIFNIEGDEKDALLIAAVLHDLGQVEGVEGHPKRSRVLVEENLSEELKENKYYNEILTAIESHSEINDYDSFFTLMLQAADKFDFSKERLIDNYQEKYDYVFTENIERVEIVNDGTYFGLNFVMNEIDNFVEQFYKYKFFYTNIKIIKKLAENLDKTPIIMKNGKVVPEITFE